MPLMHSQMSMQLEGGGWQRGCTDICYYPNNIRRKGCAISYYTLTFTFVAKFSRDQVYFAHSYPYTYRFNTALQFHSHPFFSPPLSHPQRPHALLLKNRVGPQEQLAREMQAAVPNPHWQPMPHADHHVIHVGRAAAAGDV